MFVNDSGIASIPSKLNGNTPKDASISFKSPTPKEFIGKLVTFSVESKIKGDLYLIKGPTGKTLEAEIKPAPQVGSSITVAFKAGGDVKLVSMQQQPTPRKPQDSADNKTPANDGAKNSKTEANIGQNSGKSVTPEAKTATANNTTKNLPTDSNQTPNPTKITSAESAAKTQLAEAQANVTKQLLKAVGETVQVKPIASNATPIPPRDGVVIPKADGQVTVPRITAANVTTPQITQTTEGVKIIQNSPLPKLNIQTFTVVTSPAKQGFQTLQPQAGTGVSPFQIKLPTEAPIGTNITVKAEANGTVKILAVDTSGADFTKKVLPETQILTKTSASPLAPKTPLTAEAVTKLDIKNAIPTLSEKQVQNIVTTGRVDVAALKNLPVGTTMELMPSTTGKTVNSENGTITQTLATKGGQAVEVKTPHQIPTGSSMTIIITKQGRIDILRVDPDTASGDATRRDPDSATRDPRFSRRLSSELSGNEKSPLAPAIPSKSIQISSTAALPIGRPIAGIVTAQGEHGALTLRLANGGTIGIQSARPLPLGTIITLEAKPDGSINLLQTKIPEASAKVDALQKFSGKWDDLNNAISQLKGSNAEKAEALKRSLPDISKPTFLINMLRFSSMVANAELSKLVDGDTLNLLRAMGIDLSADVQQLNSLQQKPEASESWRSLFFPYSEGDDSDTSQGSFFWRQGEDESSDETHIRFIVQITLSQLGPIQIDGLMEKSHLLIKLRLKQDVSEEDQKELKMIVNTVLENLSLTGDILIDYLERHEVDPTQELTKNKQTLNVNI